MRLGTGGSISTRMARAGALLAFAAAAASLSPAAQTPSTQEPAAQQSGNSSPATQSSTATPAPPTSPRAGTTPSAAPSATPAAPQQPAPASAELTTRTSQTPFQSSVNLVPVRVVVRDGSGKAVTNLQREDFQVYQDGKLQLVAHFAVLTPEAQTVVRAVPTVTDTESAGVPGRLQLPSRYVAILFDDVHFETTDLLRARVAANKYIDSVNDPSTRFALYTTSGQFQSDFTDDPAAIHKSINALMPRPVGAFVINETGQCPPMDYYEADLIQNRNDPVAIQAAEQDAMKCSGATNVQMAAGVVMNTAQQVITAGDANTQYSMRRLSEILKRMAALPGQRSIVLVSPGFLIPTFMTEESEIIDRAEHENVFINTLDGRGLYTVDPIGDITQEVPAYSGANTAGLASMYRSLSAMANDDVMRDLAAGTGGVAFLNNNDLYAGLVQTAGKPEVSYLLAYSPSGLKNDGKFHSIKVKLTGKQHYSLQARRGFFAPKKDVTPDDLAKQDIEDAVFSQEEQASFPVQMHLQYFMTGTGNAKLSVLTHVDVNSVHFDQHDGRHWDDLTIVAALFDRNGNFIEGDEKTLELRLKDPTLSRLEQSGVTIKSSFDVKSGGYLVRLVVRDTKGASIASKNGVVEIP
ncbi:MAG: VWA domain-containing protein [Candidatus Acidiferrales bacterium]